MLLKSRHALVLVLLCLCYRAPLASAEQPAGYWVGQGIADITGPAVGLKMLGYVRPDQISEGIHLRQYARTFVVAQPDGAARLALVTTDLQSVTHSLVLSVLDRLRPVTGDAYTVQNVVIAATHTHAVPGGYWHYSADTPLGAPLYQEHFDAIAAGIADSILTAHRALAPCRIFVTRGDVIDGGRQRSAKAYLQNPAEERSRYAADIDTEMIQLRFESEGQLRGILNWHAVHPTSMSFTNRLISSDNKGYAAYALQRAVRAELGPKASGFVAAFAQANCGDVTPNLNLNHTGPGKDEFESTRIMGDRQVATARQLLADPGEELLGPVDVRQAYVDFSRVAVGDAFTHQGPQTTSPAAYGYSFAAGSSEDGGGQPLFKEGMLRPDPLIETIAKNFLPLPPPSAPMRAGHRPKPILLAVGAANPPALPPVLPISVARIGSLGIVVGPAEFTTMSGRRFRAAVQAALPELRRIVIAGYANDYASYVATREEYESQQYEGASTLFGPWTQAAYQQEFARLASDLAAGRASTTAEPPLDVRPLVRPTPLGTRYDLDPPDARFGDIVRQAPADAAPGERVMVVFWSGTPRNGYRPDRQFAMLQRQANDAGDAWQTIATDGDWDLKCWWKQPADTADPSASREDRRLAAHHFTIAWDVPPATTPGIYRLVHHGVYKSQATGQLVEFTATSGLIRVGEPARSGNAPVNHAQ